MKNFLIFFCAVAAVAVVAAKSYCDLSCKDPVTGEVTKHIACGHNKLFDEKNCPKNAKLIPITDSLKKMLVDAHNKKRNFIAGGGDPNHKPACRMATMEWDDELAELATLNVKKCDLDHDKCYVTNSFEYTGQNLYTTWLNAGVDFDSKELLMNAVEGWYSEVENSTQKYIDSYPETSPMIGHFTVMMADRNTHVGCAAASYTTNETTFATACNYATSNMLKSPIYEKCKSAGEKCKTKTNKKYKNLCSPKEKYDVNNWN